MQAGAVLRVGLAALAWGNHQQLQSALQGQTEGPLCLPQNFIFRDAPSFAVLWGECARKTLASTSISFP